MSGVQEVNQEVQGVSQDVSQEVQEEVEMVHVPSSCREQERVVSKVGHRHLLYLFTVNLLPDVGRLGKSTLTGSRTRRSNCQCRFLSI